MHWAYDRGGYADGPGWIPKGPRPERVLSPRQTSSFENLVRVLDRGHGVGAVNINLSAPNYIGSQTELLTTLNRAARTGQLGGILRAAGVQL